jgi:hypothetical protein
MMRTRRPLDYQTIEPIQARLAAPAGLAAV